MRPRLAQAHAREGVSLTCLSTSPKSVPIYKAYQGPLAKQCGTWFPFEISPTDVGWEEKNCELLLKEERELEGVGENDPLSLHQCERMCSFRVKKIKELKRVARQENPWKRDLGIQNPPEGWSGSVPPSMRVGGQVPLE
ncbi:hypothetical protein VNO77_03378 [Canavalia gladiata]|uniref:Uncharacterized protein n=1 Tax=Canavalia gladiata TaxID=3824 RepID=A0AAN9N118_CANGL